MPVKSAGLILGAAAAAGGLGAFSSWERGRLARQRKSAGRYVDRLKVAGVELCCATKGSGTPVVLLHASGLALEDFTFSIFEQVARSFRAIAFDRAGYGASQVLPGPVTLAMNASLIHGALVQMGVKHPILAGHSTGAAVALRYALDYPDETAGLLLLAPTAYATALALPNLSKFTRTPVLAPLFLNLGLPLLAPSFHFFVSRLFEPAPVPPGYARAIEASLVQARHMRTWAGELRNLLPGLDSQSSRYPEIRVPAVIVAGPRDRFSPPRFQARPLQRAIPNSRLVLVANAGHMVHHQAAAVVMDALDAISRRRGHVISGTFG
jgi:pimeloyl-ACP methyl ester carboxylesterase